METLSVCAILSQLLVSNKKGTMTDSIDSIDCRDSNLGLEIERECSILMVVELAVGRLAGGPDAVKAQLSGSG